MSDKYIHYEDFIFFFGIKCTNY